MTMYLQPVIDKDRFNPDEETVETISLAETVSGVSEDEGKAGFTDQDYSDYTPEDTGKEPEEESVSIVDDQGLDEDKLYDE